MKSISIFCLGVVFAVLSAESLRAENDDPPHRRGGFTGATPTPAPKKKTGTASAATAKKKKASEDDAPKEQKAESSPRTKASEPVEKAAPSARESTPAPKKKRQQSDDAEPAGKKSETADAPVKPAKPSDAETTITSPPKPEHAPAATLEPNELAEFASLPARTQSLITTALALTKLNLTYAYGSDDPAQGGMDCSGTMAYLLRAQGFKDVPRDSSSQYVWARKGGPFFAVVSKSAESFEFKDLQPGDLLFWTGTYETGREIPISHVMLYLGTEKKTKKRVMFGSSDGRSYAGIQRWGVSVFDFKMPHGTAANGEPNKVDFVGYGRIPGLHAAEIAEAKTEPAPAAIETPEEKPNPVVKKSTAAKKKRSSSAAKN